MILNKESAKHLNRLCESVLRKFNLADKAQLKGLLQNEINVTLDRFLTSNKLTSSKNDMFPAEGAAVILAPLNSLDDISRNSVNGSLDVYIRAEYYLDQPDVVTGDGGEEFLNTRSTLESTNLYLGTLKIAGNNISLILDDNVDPALIDIDLYSKCWDTGDPKNVVFFLNDIYNRLYKSGIYATSNLLSSPTNNAIIHISYGKLLAYAKGLYPFTVGNEAEIMRNILTDLLNMPVQNVIIDRPANDISFAVIVDDKDKQAIKGINQALEQFV